MTLIIQTGIHVGGTGKTRAEERNLPQEIPSGRWTGEGANGFSFKDLPFHPHRRPEFVDLVPSCTTPAWRGNGGQSEQARGSLQRGTTGQNEWAPPTEDTCELPITHRTTTTQHPQRQKLVLQDQHGYESRSPPSSHNSPPSCQPTWSSSPVFYFLSSFSLPIILPSPFSEETPISWWSVVFIYFLLIEFWLAFLESV